MATAECETPTRPGVGCPAGVNTASQACKAGRGEAVHRHGCFQGGCAHRQAAAASYMPATSLSTTAAATPHLHEFPGGSGAEDALVDERISAPAGHEGQQESTGPGHRVSNAISAQGTISY